MPTKHLISNRYEYVAADNGDTFLGQGGMGTVFMGTDTQTGEQVAVKLLKPEVVEQAPDMVRRFQVEGEALRQLNHPNIVKMLATDDINNRHYIVMEYVEGGSLLDVLEETPRLTIQRVLYIALDVADALTRAHRLNILHRDIKPGNVLIAKDGTPRLTDFGMARIGDSQVTQDGMILGTLAYLSPEVFNDAAIDERSDIWAFGIMLFEMLTGQRPFPESQPGALINSILSKPVPDLETLRPDTPVALVDLIYRMLKKEAHARIPSIRLIGAELESIIRGGSESVQPIVRVDDTTGRFATPTPSPAASTSEITLTYKLPAQPTPFVGRERELEAIGNLLTDDDARLITILGPGGIGKTRIALAAAEQHLSAYADGVFFIPLAGLDNPEHLVSTFAEHLGFSFGGASDDRTQLINYLSEKEMLLIVDSFEFLTGSANLLSDILQASVGVQMMVTSRERLRLRGEQIYEIEGMILPSTNLSVEEMGTYPCVMLFLQSAHRVKPDFELDDETAPLVAKIIQLVNGLPLGIELAAGWLEMLPIDEIANEIEQSLDFLETDLQDVPERHRSIRAVFEYSWNLLTEDERRVFLKLSIFRGGFEREAAQKVSGASLRNLTALVNKSLLQREPSGRYYAHKLLRQYAEDQFKTDPEKDTVCEAHALYYGEFLSRLESAFNSKNEQAALESIEKEIENIRVAWYWAMDHDYWQAIDRVIHTMMLFYQGRSMLREGVDSFRELAERLIAKGMEDSDTYWRARSREAWLVGRLGEYELVWEYASGAVAHFEKQGDQLETIYGLNNMSYARMMQGQYDEAIIHAKAAMMLSETADDAGMIYNSKANWGYAEYLKGNYQEAKRLYVEVTEDADENNFSPIGLAFGYNNLGEIVRDMGDLEAARDLTQKAHDIFKAYKQRRGIGFTLNNLAGIFFRQGAQVEAEENYEKAYRLHREIGDISGMAHSISGMGGAKMFVGDYESAKHCYSESLQLRRQIGDQRGIGDSLMDLARIAVMQKDLEQAQQLYDEGMSIRQQIGDRAGMSQGLAGMGMSLLMKGDIKEARQYLQDALELAREIQMQFVVAQALAGLSGVALHEGNHQQAKGILKEALQVAWDIQTLPLMLFGLTAFADIYSTEGDTAQALELVAQVLQYPSNFLSFAEEKAQKLMDKLTASLPKAEAEAAIERGRSQHLEDMVAALLKA